MNKDDAELLFEDEEDIELNKKTETITQKNEEEFIKGIKRYASRNKKTDDVAINECDHGFVNFNNTCIGSKSKGLPSDATKSK